MRPFIGIMTALALTATASLALGAEARPYKEGPITTLEYIKIKPGKFDDYMKFLSSSWKQVHDAEKKEGLILGYTIYEANPRTPKEPDLIIAITYPNYAALDKTDEFEAVATKVAGPRDAAIKASVEREQIREILGGELVRELILK